MKKRATKRVWLLLVALAVAGCAGPSKRSSSVAPARIWVASMQHEASVLRTDQASCTLEVDWAAGSAPTLQSLEHLARTFERYTGREAVLNVAARPAFEHAFTAREQLESAADKAIESDPSPCVMWIVYLANSDALYEPGLSGIADTVVHQGSRVPAILVFTEELERDAMLWITRAKVERAALVHELGHHFGLVNNPAHAQAEDAHHCTRADCVMNRPRASDLLSNALPALAGRIPLDFCKACRADLERARESAALWPGSASNAVD